MKRFYTEVTTEHTDLGWRVALDGRPVKTQGGRPQAVPNRELAEMLCREWDEQGHTIDPAAFFARDMTDYAIDVVAPDPAASHERVMRYAETDTLCYRADPDEPLWKRQQEMWEPLVAAFEAREGVRMERVSGIVHRAPSPDTLANLRKRLEQLEPLLLAPLETLTSLAASVCIGLSALDPKADGDALWNAANLEEDWQMEQWGSDEEAAERRAKKRGEFLAAFEFARAVRT